MAHYRLVLLLLALLPAACAHGPRVLDTGSSAWRIEDETGATVRHLPDGTIDIDTAAGLTLWYHKPFTGPVAIEFEAMAVSEGGPNDQVSDLNAFWMATDADGAQPRPRSGAFATYDDLRTYYVGIGGNRNSTTRFRRYIGTPGNRPLLPEHDLGAPHLLTPNVWTRIRLIADGQTIAVERDGRRIFQLQDAQSYTKGWFAIRTTKSHLRVRNLRVGKP